MRLLLFFLAFLFGGSMSIAQPVLTTTKGTVIFTSPSRVSVYAKPADALPSRLFRAIQICVSIPDQGVGNPIVTIDANYVTNISWTPLSMVVYNSRAYYTFLGSDNGLTTTTSWTTFNNIVATLLFSNTNGLSGVQLNDESPSFGPNGNLAWYVEVINVGNGDITNYIEKFYGAVSNPPINNDGAPSFVNGQSASLLPILLQDFNVSKQGSSDAFLTWTTSLEQNVSHFILERSVNGTNGWFKIAEVKAKGNSNSPTKYSYTDVKVYDGIQATKTIFFRIRSIDLDGQEKIFPIRSLRFAATGGKEISIYPNPVKDGFTISIPIVNPRNSMIRLNLVNHLGQLIHGREVSAASAANYFYDIKTPGIINGEYLLQVIYDGELLDTKKVIVQR